MLHDMGNFSVYLNSDEKRKIENIAESCSVPRGNILRILIKSFDEEYLKALVQAYKQN